MLLGSLTTVLAATLLIAGGGRAHGDPAGEPSKIRSAEVSQHLVQAPGNPRLTVFTSPDGEFSFEAPAAWADPLDPRDPARVAFFVGPVDQARRTVVWLAVSRYPGKSASVQAMIEELQSDKRKQIVSNETRVVDQHPARFLTIHELATHPLWEDGSLPLALHERFVLIEDGPYLYVLEYVSSLELYGKYLPIFDRLVTSFHFHHKRGG